MEAGWVLEQIWTGFLGLPGFSLAMYRLKRKTCNVMCATQTYLSKLRQSYEKHKPNVDTGGVCGLQEKACYNTTQL
jgi:hypothetical protein